MTSSSPDNLRRIAGEEDDKADDTPKPKSAQDLALEAARGEYADFQGRYEKTINAYYGTPDVTFTMKPGGWYIDLEKIQVNADPTFFIEKGYSEAEALFATFHEAEHFRDMIQDSEAYLELFERFKTRTDVDRGYPKVLARLYNCVDDILVNNAVMKRWRAGVVAKDALYPKLFPSAVLNVHPETGTPQPRHRQFMYALLRQAMMPGEEVQVDDEVREALAKVQSAKGGRAGIIERVTEVDIRGQSVLAPDTRFSLMQDGLESIFEELYRKDLVDRKSKPGPGQGEPGKGEPGESDFGDDPFESAIPDPIDFEDIAEGVKNINQSIAKKKSDAYKEAMGVEKQDLEAYARDYEKVKPFIDELSRTFDDVIDRRKTTHRVLRKVVKEGPIIDPRKAATAVAEIRAGNLEPMVMLDYERQETIKNVPSEIEFTIVCDGSGSMTSGGKDAMQRRLVILAMEAFADFRERVAKARRAGERINLAIRSEARIFADNDAVLKPLSESLTHPERVSLHKSLKKLPSGNNNEPATFQAMSREQFNNERLQKLRSGDLRKIVLFLTDGETDVSAIQREIRWLMEKAGVTKEGKSGLVIAAIGFGEGKQAKTTYAPNGYYAESLDKVKDIFQDFLRKMLEDV